MELMVLLVFCFTVVGANNLHNIYRGSTFSWSVSLSFLVPEEILRRSSSQINSTVPSRSLVECSSKCQRRLFCAGLMYLAGQCHLLHSAKGLKDAANTNGTVQVIVYEIDNQGWFDPAYEECGDVMPITDQHQMLMHHNATEFIDCLHWYEMGYLWSGVYCINPDGSNPFHAYCDMENDGGGWTVFQRRVDASTDFYRGWNDYVSGFGSLDSNLWIGLDNLHRMATAHITEPHIYMDTFEGESAYARYDQFAVAAAPGYELSVSQYSGTTGDSLSPHNSRKFSTFDNNQYPSSRNCAADFLGAWWYTSCHYSNLNGYYYGGAHNTTAKGVNWHSFKGHNYSLKTSVMKLRRVK